MKHIKRFGIGLLISSLFIGGALGLIQLVMSFPYVGIPLCFIIPLSPLMYLMGSEFV